MNIYNFSCKPKSKAASLSQGVTRFSIVNYSDRKSSIKFFKRQWVTQATNLQTTNHWWSTSSTDHPWTFKFISSGSSLKFIDRQYYINYCG